MGVVFSFTIFIAETRLGSCYFTCKIPLNKSKATLRGLALLIKQGIFIKRGEGGCYTRQYSFRKSRETAQHSRCEPFTIENRWYRDAPSCKMGATVNRSQGKPKINEIVFRNSVASEKNSQNPQESPLHKASESNYRKNFLSDKNYGNQVA